MKSPHEKSTHHVRHLQNQRAGFRTILTPLNLEFENTIEEFDSNYIASVDRIPNTETDLRATKGKG